MKKLLLSLFISLYALTAHGYSQQVIDSLVYELSRATTFEDSLRLSYDLFDGAQRLDQPMRGRQVLALLERTDNYDARLDMIRQIANISSRTEGMYDEMYRKLDSIPDSDEKSLTKLFLRIRQSTAAARNTKASESREKINHLMNKVENSNGTSVNTKIEVLFTLCAYLEQMVSPEMMSDYLEQIGELIKHLPQQNDAIESLYLTQSALTYTSFYMNDKAVEADKKLLQHIEKLKAQYAAQGRFHRDFAYSQYVIYRRLLANYPALTPQEVEEYYQKCKELAKADPAAMRDFTITRRPDLYYFMARKEYAKVLPILKEENENPKPSVQSYIRRLMLNMQFEAAQAVGNKEDQLSALVKLRDLDDNEQTRQSAEQFQRLQFIYDRSNQKLLETQLELQKRDAEIATHRITLIIGSISVAILIVLVIILARTWQKAKGLNAKLQSSNAKLTEERDTLQRTQADLIKTGERMRVAEKQKEEFIDNMSHEVSTPLNAIVEYSQLIVDCVDDDKNPYLTRFADVVKLNSDLLQMLFNDVLDLSSIDKGNMKIETQPVTVGQFASVITDTIKSHLKPGVELISEISPDDKTIIHTDSKRAAQVLINLLDNATKFTTEGSITLSGKVMEDGKNYQFTVTDTGIGIPVGKEEVIFERFEKLNRYSQGIGLGLPVCRLIASLLGGTVKLDTTYSESGSRFIFTLPLK